MEEAIKCLSKRILKLEKKQKPYINMSFLSDYHGNETVSTIINYYQERINDLQIAIQKLT